MTHIKQSIDEIPKEKIRAYYSVYIPKWKIIKTSGWENIL